MKANETDNSMLSRKFCQAQHGVGMNEAELQRR